MHTGLSPDYRGTACAFWPIVENRPDMVGATVHECTSDVDGGRIYFREKAKPQRGDGLHAIFARAVVTGAAGYAKIAAQAVSGEITGEVQNLLTGREYRGFMLGILPELRARWNLARLQPNLPRVHEFS
jgi:methionyl-tRNA formyltransferase